MKEIVEEFLSDLARAVVKASESVVSPKDLEAATGEMAEAVLARYTKKHPAVFSTAMRLTALNVCACGECRDCVVLHLNEPLLMLLKRTGVQAGGMA